MSISNQAAIGTGALFGYTILVLPAMSGAPKELLLRPTQAAHVD